MRVVQLTVLACLLVAGSLHAATEGIAQICEDRICLIRRPVLAAPSGWMHDRTASDESRMTVFVPTGETFATAKAVLYGKATPRDGEGATLETFIEDDIATFRRENPGIVVADRPALRLADGTNVRVVSFAPGPGAQHDVEAVAYVAERDDFVVFVLSARDQVAYEANLESLRGLVASYVPGQGTSAEPSAAVIGGASPSK